VVVLLHDLSGNVVGEAALSETETKLLKSYNSTEFGVPSGKEAPPKYAWLGAAGVAGELSSGVVTQDGVSYVPVTGRPLQAEGVVLPAPDNASTPFSWPVEAWVGSKAGEGAAIGLAKAKQREEEREAADQPPGAIPIPPGAYGCEGEPGGCGEEGGGGGGCSGMKACVASTHHLCHIDMRFGEPGPNFLLAESVFGCSKHVAYFQLQLCILIEYPGKPKANLECNGAKGETFENRTKGGARVSGSCSIGVPYRGWVWGRVYGMGTLSEVIGGGATARWWCTGNGTVDALQNAIEYVLT
jgi:hypothetical protein